MLQWYSFAALASRCGCGSGSGRACRREGFMTTPVGSAPPRTDTKTRRTLLLILLVGLAPVIASYAFYYFSPRDAHANYGELLATRPAAEIAGTTLDGKPFRLSDLRGRWVLVAAAPGGCDAACGRKLYATRQARTMQGREQERVARVWLVTDGAAPPARSWPSIPISSSSASIPRPPRRCRAAPRGSRWSIRSATRCWPGPATPTSRASRAISAGSSRPRRSAKRIAPRSRTHSRTGVATPSKGRHCPTMRASATPPDGGEPCPTGGIEYEPLSPHATSHRRACRTRAGLGARPIRRRQDRTHPAADRPVRVDRTTDRGRARASTWRRTAPRSPARRSSSSSRTTPASPTSPSASRRSWWSTTRSTCSRASASRRSRSRPRRSPPRPRCRWS